MTDSENSSHIHGKPEHLELQITCDDEADTVQPQTGPEHGATLLINGDDIQIDLSPSDSESDWDHLRWAKNTTADSTHDCPTWISFDSRDY